MQNDLPYAFCAGCQGELYRYDWFWQTEEGILCMTCGKQREETGNLPLQTGARLTVWEETERNL
jgi:heterodisulfide reductase subunit B